jgi:hypothetical protein
MKKYTERKLQSNNKSGFRGIYFNNKRNKWGASLNHNKKRYFLGYYYDLQKAIKVYLDACEKYKGFSTHRDIKTIYIKNKPYSFKELSNLLGVSYEYIYKLDKQNRLYSRVLDFLKLS